MMTESFYVIRGLSEWKWHCDFCDISKSVMILPPGHDISSRTRQRSTTAENFVGLLLAHQTSFVL